MWKQIATVPDIPVEHPPAEQVLVLNGHCDPDYRPVSNQAEPIDEDCEQLIAARDSNDSEDDARESAPDDARDSRERVTKLLPVECRSVRAWDAVRCNTKRENHAAEFAKVTERMIRFYDERADAVGSERGFPVCVFQEPGSETDAQELDQELSEDDSAGRCGEDQILVGVLGVVCNVVGGCGRPAEWARGGEEEVGKTVSGEGCS